MAKKKGRKKRYKKGGRKALAKPCERTLETETVPRDRPIASILLAQNFVRLNRKLGVTRLCSHGFAYECRVFICAWCVNVPATMFAWLSLSHECMVQPWAVQGFSLMSVRLYVSLLRAASIWLCICMMSFGPCSYLRSL